MLTLRNLQIPTEPIKEGWLTKEGGAFKSWCRRWFRVYPDYTIEYFEKPGVCLDFAEFRWFIF